MNTIKELVTWSTSELGAVSNSPRLDSEILLSEVVGRSRVILHAHPELEVLPDQEEKFRSFVARRKNRESVAGIIGKKEFFGLEFFVNSHVLIPRPETELLVELALKYCRSHQEKHLEILDLGTGSGCISVALAHSLAKENFSFQITSVDLSLEALQVARSNAERHRVLDRINFIESNWFSALPRGHSYNLILSNPPYIAEGKRSELPDISHEPEMALFSGEDGFRDLELILKTLPEYLPQDGMFLCEIDSSLVSYVDNLFKGTASNYKFHKDMAGMERVLELTF